MTAEPENQASPEPTTLRGEIAGPLRAVLRILIALAVVGLFVLALIVVSYVAASTRSVILRLVIGSALSIAIAWIGIGYFRQLQHPPPPDPQPAEVHPSLRLAYVCEMCGLEVALLRVAKEKAPKHCGEEMVLVRRDAPEISAD
ncbi:MAG: hypothetical protein ACRDJ4_11930 [Actinomycetota bacterium]